MKNTISSHSPIKNSLPHGTKTSIMVKDAVIRKNQGNIRDSGGEKHYE